MFPPSWASAAPNAEPCWVAIATDAASSSHRLRPATSYRQSATASAVGIATAAIVSSRPGRSPPRRGGASGGRTAVAVAALIPRTWPRSEERRVGKSVDLGGRRNIKKEKHIEKVRRTREAHQ